MDVKNILLEEIKRISYISNYKLEETSEENKKNIVEAYPGFSAFRDLASTREGAASLRSEFEAALSSGLEIRTIKGVGGASKKLTKASEILKALKEGKIAESSLIDLKAFVFKNTKDPKIMEAFAKDLVETKEWQELYSHLSDREILQNLKDSGLNISPSSEQARYILNAHDAKIAKDAKIERELDDLRNFEQEAGMYRSEKEWKDYSQLRTEEEKYREFVKRYGKKNIKNEARQRPKTLYKRLKKAGAFIWKAGGWVWSNAWTILILGLIGWGAYTYFNMENGIGDGCDEGFERDSSGKCVKKGTSGDEDYEQDNRIRDEQGNVYDPCSGIFKINCVTKEGEGGIDYISKAQDCLGLSPTGMFNKQLEDALFKKINKRTFTKNDIKFICMRGATLAEL